MSATTELTLSNRRRRVLVVANEAVTGEELTGALRRHLGGSGEEASIFVVAPALARSAIAHELGAVDDAIGPAESRLERSLSALRSAGMEAAGEVGDSDPVVAISDELQKFPAEEIVLVTHRESQRAYAEKGVLERAERDFDPPLTELVVDAEDREPTVVDVHEAPAGAEREAEGPRGYGVPFVSAGDILGIAIGMIGTAILVVLAASSAASDPSPIEGANAARILIAGAALLINLAHVVGLLLFQSVRYKGIWERYFLRLTAVGTTAAVVVSVLLG